MVVYSVADEMKDACKFCATIARGRFRTEQPEFDKDYGWSIDARGVVPFAREDTATLTFIDLDGRCYAVTAAHVIDTFTKMANDEGYPLEGYYLPKAPGVMFTGPFLRLPRRTGNQEVDIAILPWPRQYVEKIDKKPYAIRADNDPTTPPSIAIAAGFPTAEKYDSCSLNKMQMKGVTAVAEGIGSRLDADQLQFYSQLHTAPEVGSLSGMSGGPVFWSFEDKHGLLGFVKEATNFTAGDPEGIFLSANSHFIVERATYQSLKDWFDFIDVNWQKERDKINAAIKGRNR